MAKNAYAQLQLETFFVEVDSPKAESSRQATVDALLELGFNARLPEDRGQDTDWIVGEALQDPLRANRFGVEVFPPASEKTSPRTAWTWAHAISGRLPDDASVQPTFAGNVSLRSDEPTEESSGSGGSDDPAPNNVRWHHENIRLTQAHSHLANLGIKPGDGVFVGHPDTGYTNHDDIVKALDIDRGINLLEEGTKPVDPREGGTLEQPGHGTATGSMIVAEDAVKVPRLKANGDAVDILGVASAAKLAPIRVSETVIIAGWQRRLAVAIEHAVDNGCKVISMSLGGLGGRRLNRAIEFAEAKGVILVAAAGNNVGFVVAPATHPLTVACAASDFENKPWSGSSKGEAVTITAPGHNVWVAGFDGNTEVARPGSGTSYATATVAGAAAMWLSVHRQKLAGHESSVPRLFRTALRTTSRTRSTLPSAKFGAGLLDCEKLITTDPIVDEGASESPSLAAHPDLVALRSLLSPAAAEESSQTRRSPAAELSRGLDEGAISELVFHLSIDPALREQWNRIDQPSTEGVLRSAISHPQRNQFSPRLLTQLRRADQAAQDITDSGATNADVGTVGVDVQTPGDGNSQNSVDVQIRLNLRITVETSE